MRAEEPSIVNSVQSGRRLALISVAVAALAVACPDGPGDPPVPTNVQVSPDSVSFTGAGQTRQLVATVLDQRGNPMADTGVTWSTTLAAVVTVSATGLATAAGPGSAEIRATAGTAVGSATVSVTLVSIAAFDGDNQTGLAGFALNVAPAVVVRDPAGNPVGGVPVDFAVASGGGSVTGAAATTSAFGVARVGRWSVGLLANTLTATAAGAGIGGNPVTFSATGVISTFSIDVRPLTAMTASQLAAFTNAAARWQTLIYGDVPDLFIDSIPAATCGANSPAIVRQTIDDVIIFATIAPIDGPGMVLGSATPCWIRLPGFLPLIGRMTFDSADVPAMESAGVFGDVILHEMGHVLGFATLWGPTELDLLRDPASQGGVDPRFIGAQAIAAFDNIGGTGYTSGAKVPVENTGGPGTADGHWRESVFGNELMTGFVGGPPNPLSVVTVASMGDEAYTVNYAGADLFTLTFPALLGVRAPLFHLKDDIAKGPIYVVDRQGRVVRVIGP